MSELVTNISRRLFNRPMGRLIFAATVIYAILWMLLPQALIVTAMDCLTMAFCLGVVWIYAPIVWDIADKQEPMLPDLLSVGVFLVCMNTAAIRGWRIIWTLLGNPEWMVNQTWFGYATLLQLIGVLLIMSAPRRANGTLFYGAWRTIAKAAGFAVILFSAILVARSYL